MRHRTIVIILKSREMFLFGTRTEETLPQRLVVFEASFPVNLDVA